MEQSVEVEEPAEEAKLQEILVHECDRPSLESLVIAQLVDFQILFVEAIGNLILGIVIIWNSNHPFDHEHDYVVGVSRVETPQTIGNVSSHRLKVLWRRLKVWSQVLSSDDFQSLHGFLVSLAADVVP